MCGRWASVRCAAAAAVAFVFCAAAPAYAGEAAAADFFRAGRAAYARKDYRAAATAFEAAYHEVPHAAVKYNAALAWELAREPARAADAFAAALAEGEGLTADQSKDARHRLDRLEDDLGRLEVAAPSGTTVSVAHLEKASAPLSIHLPPGEHELVAALPDGGERRRKVRVRSGRVASVRFSTATTATTVEQPPEVPPDPPPQRALPRAPPDEPADAGDSGSAMRAVGWVGVGLGVASAISATALGVAALDARDEWEADHLERGPDADVAIRDRAATLRTWTNVAWVAAGAFAVGGVVLIVVAPEADPRTRATVRITPAGAALHGVF